MRNKVWSRVGFLGTRKEFSSMKDISFISLKTIRHVFHISALEDSLKKKKFVTGKWLTLVSQNSQ